jgi:tripartite-type tricarboxylate transporter receptor subunit TctC
MVGNMGPTSWLSHYKVGTIKPLLRGEEEPMPGVPNLPSQEELYNLPLPPANAHLIVVPKGVPKPIVDKLVAAFMAGKKSPQYEALAERLSFSNAKILTGDELNKWVESTYDLYGKLIGELGIKAVPEKK